MSTDTHHADGQRAVGASPRTLELGGRTVHIERPSGLKASRALAGIRGLSRAAPELQTDLAAFRRKYETENVVELDRVQAKLRFPPVPILDDSGQPTVDEHGQPVLMPSPVDRLTEEDWERSGGIYRMPVSPSGAEVATALLDRGLELAELHVYRLLALFTVANDDLKRYRRDGSLEERLDGFAADLLDDAYADELMELVVVVAETVDGHFRRKAASMGDRLGKTLALFGISYQPTTPPTESTPTSPSNDGPSTSKPSSSTASPSPTPDGPQTSSSTSPSSSSSSSPDDSKTTPKPEPSPTTMAA